MTFSVHYLDKWTEVKAIYEHLGRVKDPEIPVLSLHDMGILRGVHVLDDNDARFKDAMETFLSAHPDAPEENAAFHLQNHH